MATQDEVKLIIKAATEQAVINLQKLNGQLTETTTKSGKLKTGITNLKSGWMGMTVTLAAAGYAFAKVINVNREFEKSIANVSAVSGLARKDLAALAREAGATTVFSAREAADALYFMASAGLKTSDEFKNVLTPTLNFAAAAQMGIAESTDLVINNLKIYNASMKDSTEFTDIMLKTVQSTNTDMVQLGGALSYSASSAKLAGFSFKDLNIILGAMADQGIKGERAGTQLRMALAKLLDVTPEAEATLNSYGITLDEITSLLPTPIKLFERLHDAGINQADGLKILGVRQADVFKLIQDGIPNMHRLQQGMQNVAGTAQSMANQQLNTLDGSLKLLNSAFQETILSTTTGSPSVSDGFKAVVQVVTTVITGFNSLTPVLKSSIGVLATMAIGIGVLTKVVTVFGVSLNAAIWPVTAIVAAIAAAIAIVKNWETVVWALKVAWEAVKFAFETVVQAFRVGFAWIALQASKAVEFIATPFLTAINTIIEGLNKLPGVHIETFNNVFEAQTAQNERMLELELERLENLHMVKVESDERTEEQEQIHSDKMLDIEQQALLKSKSQKQKNLKEELKNQIEQNKKLYQIDTELIKLKIENRGLDTANYMTWSNFMMSSMDKNSKWQFALWKAFAIQQTTINTYSAAVAGYNAMAGIPYVGPALGAAAAAAAITFGLMQVSRIAKSDFKGAEEGALIRGVPGASGTLIRAGENNKDEAIIPLENSDVMDRMGTTVNVNFNVDTMIAGEDFPRETAMRIDDALYRLKQEGLSKL